MMAEKLAPPAGSNLTDTTYLEFRREYALAVADRESAVARERQVLKRAKAAGVDIKAMRALISLRKQDPDALKLEQRAIAQYAAWEGVKDLPLFGGGPVEAPSMAAQAAAGEWAAEEAGFENGKAGGNGADDSPWPAGTPNFVAFMRGWTRGQALLAEGLVKGGKKSKKADTSKKKPDVAARRGRKAADPNANATIN